MTYAGRIRTWLILIALLPPLLVMWVIYSYSENELKNADRMDAHRGLERYERFYEAYSVDLIDDIQQLSQSGSVKNAVAAVRSGRPKRVDISELPPGIDFLEILNSDFTVAASVRRPGLLGELIHDNLTIARLEQSVLLPTVEYDLRGPNAALAGIVSYRDSLYLYAGRFLTDAFVASTGDLIDANVNLNYSTDDDLQFRQMRSGQLYYHDLRYTSVLLGGKEAGFFMVAVYETGASRPVFLSLLKVTGIVAFGSVLIAIVLGWFITSRTKREIENLIQATDRIAEGDLSTPVMAYREGEFSQLSDSISDMMVNLRQSNQKLATSEKIAAWQTVGRKVAHEVKNPLTPIAISVEDLKRAYDQKQPDFEVHLNQTVKTVRTEIRRVTNLLDQFVGFARMPAPKIVDAAPSEILDDLYVLHKNELKSGRLIVDNSSERSLFRVDPESIKQVLINLIKNGFESGEMTKVTVSITDFEKGITVCVEDTGPGFAQEKLDNGFQPYVSNRKGGTGLGLVICQRIVHDHGGTIELYNPASGGAGVTFNLPFEHGTNTNN